MRDTVIDCDQALRLLAAFLDRELEGGDHDAVRAHLDLCRSCYSRAEFERRLKVSLAELRREPLEPRFEERIRELLRETGGAPEGGGADA